MKARGDEWKKGKKEEEGGKKKRGNKLNDGRE